MDNEGKLKEEEGGEKDEWDDGEGGDDVSIILYCLKSKSALLP